MSDDLVSKILNLILSPEPSTRYGVSDDLVSSLNPIPVIRVPYTLDSANTSVTNATGANGSAINATVNNGSAVNWTTGCAELACSEYRVSSQNDREQLDKSGSRQPTIPESRGHEHLGPEP